MVTVGRPSVLLRVTPPHPIARSKEIMAQYLNESTWRRFPNRGTTGKGFLPSIAHVVGFSRQSGRNLPTYVRRHIGNSVLTQEGIVLLEKFENRAQRPELTQDYGFSSYIDAQRAQLRCPMTPWSQRVHLPLRPHSICANCDQPPIRKIPVTTGLSFLPFALANALMVNSVPFTTIGA